MPMVISNEDERKFQGYLSVEVVDKQGELIPITEIEKVMDTLMKRGGFITDEHSNRVVGKIVNWQKTEKDGKPAILVTGVIFKDYKIDDIVWERIKTGEYSGLSFGGSNTQKMEKYIGGKPVRVLADLESYEVAVCSEPANPEAKIMEVNTLAKSDKEEKKVEVEDVEKSIEKSDIELDFVNKPFAGFKNWDECMAKMKEEGYDEETAKKICGKLKNEYEDVSKAYQYVKDIPDNYELLTEYDEDLLGEFEDAEDYGSFFVLIRDGEVVDAYGCKRSVPYNNEPVYRLKKKPLKIGKSKIDVEKMRELFKTLDDTDKFALRFGMLPEKVGRVTKCEYMYLVKLANDEKVKETNKNFVGKKREDLCKEMIRKIEVLEEILKYEKEKNIKGSISK